MLQGDQRRNPNVALLLKHLAFSQTQARCVSIVGKVGRELRFLASQIRLCVCSGLQRARAQRTLGKYLGVNASIKE